MINRDPGFAVAGRVATGDSALGLIVFPAGTLDTASTRLRAWPIFDQLTDKRECSFDELFIGSTFHQPILWFQKKVTEQHLLLARKFKERGSYIIYDCDDSGAALSYWAKPHLVFEMFHLADEITADTPERIKWIKKSGSLAALSILENQIDYGMPRDGFNFTSKPKAGGKMRILWYGNSSNLIALNNVWGLFSNSRDYQLVLCGATADDANKLMPGCDVEIHQWNLDSFLDILGSCDLCILSHSGTLSDFRKSGHKMITSICHGVPVVASATPDYARIARYAGVESYLFSGAIELELILKRLLDAEARSNYLSRSRPPLMERYYPGSFGHNAIAILDRASRRRTGPTRIYQSILRGNLGLVGSSLLRVFGKTYWRRLQS